MILTVNIIHLHHWSQHFLPLSSTKIYTLVCLFLEYLAIHESTYLYILSYY